MAGASTVADVRRRGRHSAPRDADWSSHHRPDIQGLRAVAVGLVVADHVLGWPGGGFIGVDVFFVISGFLITGLLVRERATTGRISFRTFYARRVRRLLPAALVTLAVTAVVASLVFLGGRVQETLTDVLWAAFFGANIHFAVQGTDYFAQSAAPSMVQHFWSLSVEEQFYLLWPALVVLAFALPLAAARRRGVLVLAVLGTVTVASFAWSLYATATSPATAYFSTFTRAWELGVGALIAVSVTRLQRLPASARAVLAWCGLAGVLASAVLIDEQTPFPGSAAALPVVSAGMLVAWGDTPGGPGARWALGSRPAGFLGAISYSLYLWHWPVLVLAGAALAPGSPVIAVGVIALSLVLASISHYCIEQPVLHTGWLLSRRPVDDARARRVFFQARTVALATVVAGSVATCALVVVAPGGGDEVDATAAAGRTSLAAATDRPDTLTVLQQDIRVAASATVWPADLDPALDELPDYLTDQWAAGCLHVDEDNVDDCRYGDPDAEQSVVVLGDSFAAAWLPALRTALDPAAWSVQSLTLGQCPNINATTTLFGEVFEACVDHREWAIDRILEERPTMVVLTHSWTAPLLDQSADRTQVFREGLTDVVQRIQESGAEVVLVGAPPGSESLQDCPTSLNGPADCVRGPADTYATQRATEDQVAADTGARAIDPEQWFCAEGRCPTYVDRTPVYADGLHVTAEYAERIGPELVAELLRP